MQDRLSAGRGRNRKRRHTSHDASTQLKYPGNARSALPQCSHKHRWPHATLHGGDPGEVRKVVRTHACALAGPVPLNLSRAPHTHVATHSPIEVGLGRLARYQSHGSVGERWGQSGRTPGYVVNTYKRLLITPLVTFVKCWRSA